MTILLPNCKSKPKADLLIYNAQIYTVDSSFSIVEALCVKNGKILDLGKKDELKSKYLFEEEKNLEGSFIYPGLIDAHCHIYGYALTLRQANLKGCNSFDEVIERLKTHNKLNPETKWVLGRGWDQNKWEIKEFPNKAKLDEVFPNKPVLIIRIDGHAALMNSKAIEEIGFNRGTVIGGGKIEIKNNELTGIVLDKACDSVRSFIGDPDDLELKSLIATAQQKCIDVGLTSVADAGLDREIIEIIRELQDSSKCHIRIYAMLNPNEENFSNYVEKGINQTDYLHIRSIKLYADGALGSRGAALLLPYTDDSKNYGIMVEPKEYYENIALKAKQYGYQLNTHAIGDSAVRLVLNVYSEVLKNSNDLRWRIEHSQVVNPEDIDKFGEFSIIPAINTTHATSDMYWAEERLGKERIKHAYVYRDLLNQNGWLCNGSDFPIEDINPLYGFYAAVARKDFEGYPKNGYQMENSLERSQALKAMTIWAAKACFEENIKGSIEPGKFADFVVLNKDIMEVELNEIPNIKVEKTYISGIERQSKN